MSYLRQMGGVIRETTFGISNIILTDAYTHYLITNTTVRKESFNIKLLNPPLAKPNWKTIVTIF